MGRSALPPEESPLDARLCAEAGAELARQRVALGLTIAQVSEKLLLSTRQVKALEEVEFAAFHNAMFHLNALKKYAQLVDLDPSLMTRIASIVAKPDAASDKAEGNVPVPIEPQSSRGFVALAASLIVAVGIGGGGYFLWARGAFTSPAPGSPAVVQAPTPPPPPREPSTPAIEPAIVAASGSAQPAVSADTLVAGTPLMFGSLRAAHPTWIFVRDTEGVVTERSLAEGESFEFETQPAYLAVGTTDAELVIGTAPVDVSRFVANGQIRLRAGDFDAIVQGASPIPAPTAAAVR